MSDDARSRRSRDAGPDAVVIGAGHNGLVAANVLAEAGWGVLVCEATDHVGGAVRSTDAVAAGFTTDLFSAFYPLAAASPVLDRLDLADNGSRWSHAPAVLAHVFPDDYCAVLSRDRQVTADSVGAFEAGDAAAWLAMTEQWDRISGHVLIANGTAVGVALGQGKPFEPAARCSPT